jgi:hypothetical protein
MLKALSQRSLPIPCQKLNLPPTVWPASCNPAYPVRTTLRTARLPRVRWAVPMLHKHWPRLSKAWSEEH